MDLAKQIKREAARHNILLQDVAEKLGVSVQALSYQINGNPKLSTLVNLASVIGCDISDFFRDSQEIIITCPHCGEKLVFTFKNEWEIKGKTLIEDVRM